MRTVTPQTHPTRFNGNNVSGFVHVSRHRAASPIKTGGLTAETRQVCLTHYVFDKKKKQKKMENLDAVNFVGFEVFH